MAQEIERKYLVNLSDVVNLDDYANNTIIQGYLSTDPKRTVRIRTCGWNGYITIKGISDETGVSRFEWEKEILFDEALELLDLCDKKIYKTRYLISIDNNQAIELDVFKKDNEGLVIAEIELDSVDDEINKPLWLGEEVTGDKRYYNLNLMLNPYNNWQFKTFQLFLLNINT